MLHIEPARVEDLDAVTSLLREARDWQRSQGVDEWRAFDGQQIASDIAGARVFVARRGAELLGTITLRQSDEPVWESDARRALYVHKLASLRRPEGRGVGAAMLQWAQDFARRAGRDCLRLDTWHDNARMRAYYERQGFRHVRDRFFPADSPLPEDYRGTWKSLYELEL
jgi:ribosomal protein S18 acetylase RimI-like enzyme